MLPKPRCDGVFSQRGTPWGLTNGLFPISVTGKLRASKKMLSEEDQTRETG